MNREGLKSFFLGFLILLENGESLVVAIVQIARCFFLVNVHNSIG